MHSSGHISLTGIYQAVPVIAVACQRAIVNVYDMHAGMRMDADIEDLLRRWTAAIRRSDRRAVH